MQIRAVVRDAPGEAIAALTQLGYEVRLPDGTRDQPSFSPTSFS